MSEELTVEELDYCDALRKTQTLVMQNGVTVPAVMFDRLIAAARRALPDDEPISEEWMNDQGGWRLHRAMKAYIRDLPTCKLCLYVPLCNTTTPWALDVEADDPATKTRNIVALTAITTRSQLTKLVEALRGGGVSKALKAYGKTALVCYRHRSIIGAAVVRFGECEACGGATNSGAGSPPRLCGKCSVAMSECSYCREKLTQ